MQIFVGHESAYSYWERATPEQRGLVLAHPQELRAIPYVESEAFPTARSLHVELPLHVLIPYAGLRRTTRDYVVHVWSGPLTQKDFYAAHENVLVASPELCYAQLASGLSLPQASLLALEMCGGFSTRLYPGEVADRSPLTTAKSLQRYVQAAFAPDSHSRVKRALNWVADGSMSPMESALFLVLCLPPRYGGYGMPFPELNARIELCDHAKRMVHKDYLKGDLVWRNHSLIVEYNSDQEHTGGYRITQDARRVNALNYEGYRVITVTPGQMRHIGDIDACAKQVAQALGKRISVRGAKQHDAQRSLCKTLFPWWTYTDCC